MKKLPFRSRSLRALWLLCFVAGSVSLRAEKPFRAAGIHGALVICGGGELPESVYARFLELAGGKDARLVVVPTAAARVGDDGAEDFLRSWKERGFASVARLHTRSRARADDPEFLAPLTRATAVWFGGGQQSRLAEAYVGTRLEQELAALLKRGGVIGGTSAGAAILSRVMIAAGKTEPRIARGFDSLPRAVIDQHFLARGRQPRLQRAIALHPDRVGVGIDEGTAFVVRGRRARVVGRSTVTIHLAASKTRPAREFALRAGDVADWTALRRAALARTRAPFPPEVPPASVVPKGSLVIVGGGRIPESVLRRFVELAGGPDALVVVVPTAQPDPIRAPDRMAALFRSVGARNVRVLHGRERADVEAPRFLEILAAAGGVWFGGGRQWRLVDAYADTKVLPLFRAVLSRGGVIGGSSAGASIQADYLVRGNPLGNRDMMAEGYERGFGFLPGVAIDQHFSQRGRLPDMEKLMETFSQLLGIGIDESTALIVRRHLGRIVGEHAVMFYNGTKATVSLKGGQAYDLRRRRVARIIRL